MKIKIIKMHEKHFSVPYEVLKKQLLLLLLLILLG